MRKLASIQRIDGIRDIPGMDRIVQYRIGGWYVISQIDQFKVDDLVVFFEVDSWVPTEFAPFLSRGREPSVFNGIKGERLKTIKIRGAISQGLILPTEQFHDYILQQGVKEIKDGLDLTELLGIQKWEPPGPSTFTASKGPVPYFIPSTDIPRIQNMKPEVVLDPGSVYYVTEKLEGETFTAYYYDGVFGICSHNHDLKLDADTNFNASAEKYDLQTILETLDMNIVIQAEQIGAGIQGNIYNLPDIQLRFFSALDLDRREYLSVEAMQTLFSGLELPMAPLVESYYTVPEGTSIDDILEDAEGFPSLEDDFKENLMPEGLVFTSRDTDAGRIVFKALNNKYLLNEKRQNPWDPNE